ncbi:MAG: hypothetical protein JNM94_12710 [Phycisphaerae bacterium]|nr:hypothetical protein [Phycisphaerae bacterium]
MEATYFDTPEAMEEARNSFEYRSGRRIYAMLAGAMSLALAIDLVHTAIALGVERMPVLRSIGSLLLLAASVLLPFGWTSVRSFAAYLAMLVSIIKIMPTVGMLSVLLKNPPAPPSGPLIVGLAIGVMPTVLTGVLCLFFGLALSLRRRVRYYLFVQGVRRSGDVAAEIAR